MKEEVGNIENTYRLRLEEVKKILSVQFEEEFNQLKKDNLMDLESIKMMYVTKLSGMQSELKRAEEEAIRKSNEI
jgi:ABC-type phosphate transport system auxiliary subunit